MSLLLYVMLLVVIEFISLPLLVMIVWLSSRLLRCERNMHTLYILVFPSVLLAFSRTKLPLIFLAGWIDKYRILYVVMLLW